MGQTVFISGANRGIGLEFVRQYLQEGNSLITTARNLSQAADLHQLQKTHSDCVNLFEMDLANEISIQNACQQIRSSVSKIDILINNAGVYGSSAPFEQLEPQSILEVFTVNCIGSFLVTKYLLPLVQNAKGKIVFITSQMGSIADNTSGSVYPYRISKCALNMLSRSLALDLKPEGIPVTTLHPGWVRTRMGGENALIDPAVSVSGLRNVISNLELEKTGQFFNYRGEVLPW